MRVKYIQVYSLHYNLLLAQNVKKVIASRTMTEAQLLCLVKSLNIPAHSYHADDMDAAITSAGLQLPRETWCKKKRASLTLNKSSTSAKYSQGTQKRLPPPQLTKPLAKKPKLDTGYSQVSWLKVACYNLFIISLFIR